MVNNAILQYQRKHLLPAFNAKVIRELYPLFWAKATEMTTLIKQEITSRSPQKSTGMISVSEWASRAALDIISEAGFGSDFHSLAHPNTDLNTSYSQAFVPDESTQPMFVLSVLTHPTLVNLLPTRYSKNQRNGVAAVTKWIHNFLDERQAKIATGKSDLKAVGNDIISVAMESGAFSVDNLVDQSKTLLGAGHETYSTCLPGDVKTMLMSYSSATAVTWGIHILSRPRYASIQERLRSEIRANLPSPTSGIPVTDEMLDKLPYLEAVTKEILRIYPPIPAMGRVVDTPLEIGGMTLPKGTQIHIHMWALNKSKKLWGDDAREFRPERWLEDPIHGGAKEALAFSTFGHGPRGCIGRGMFHYSSLSRSSILTRGRIRTRREQGADGAVDWKF